MKKIFTSSFWVFASGTLFAQTITYANFSQALNDTNVINVANNSSFNSAITTVTGTGVTWDASGLTVLAGPPTINLSFHASASTPYSSLYSSSNYAEYDPALTSMLAYMYYGYSADSIVEWGSYEPDTKHEIFQNPDKHLIFPFSPSQSFVDTYSKTNYSDATTISSCQTGTRTVTYSGYGSLILPQGTINNVAFVTEVRTNSIGPISYYYTWYNASNGKRLLYRSENGSSITTAWNAEAVTSVNEPLNENLVSIFPNPMLNSATLKLYQSELFQNTKLNILNANGVIVKSIVIQSIETKINRDNLPSGMYFIQLITNDKSVYNKSIILN